MNPQITDKTNSIYIFVISVITVIVIFMYGKINYTIEPFSKHDLMFYMKIAEASPKIDPNVLQPYVYRILGPYIVGLLPLDTTLGFYVFTIVASVSLVVLLYSFLCYLGIQRPVAAFTTVLFILNKYFFGLTVWDYFQINDILSLIYIIILFRAMLSSNWLTFAITLFLAALTRETAMVMVPVAFVFLLEKKRFTHEGKAFMLAILPAIACFLLLRLLIHPAGGLNPLQNLMLYGKKIISPEALFRLWIGSFIPFSLLPIIFIKTTLSFFEDKKYMLVLVVLVFLSTLLGANMERLMTPTFVVFYPLIASIIQDSIYPNRIILSILLIGALLSSLHHTMGRYPLPNINIMIIISLSSLMVVTIVSYIFKTMTVKKA